MRNLFIIAIASFFIGVIFSDIYNYSKLENYRDLTNKQQVVLKECDKLSGELVILTKDQQKTMDELVSMVSTEK